MTLPSKPHLSPSLVDPGTGIAIPHVDVSVPIGTQMPLPGTGTGPKTLNVKRHDAVDACQLDFKR
jgi:hypothetical protein